MQKIIDSIINENHKLFGQNPSIRKINARFTNTIYLIDDSFIVKICTNKNNEENFKKEIEFYHSNQDYDFIPKLYSSSIDKKKVPYCYEIIKKIEGVSLYNIWHTLEEKQREEIIKQLCTVMKKIHSNVKQGYDWTNFLKTKFSSYYSKGKELHIFNLEEQQLIDYAYSKFGRYLESKDFVFTHNDLHFDNIFYQNGKIKLIDFERSMYAPRDFELDILYRMVRKPWKFASEQTEKYTNSSDYTNIKLYVAKYYQELSHTPFLAQRLAIYEMVYSLKHLVNHPDLEELKTDVLESAKVVSLKDELAFNQITTPSLLMDYMNINIEYGYIDKDGEKHLNLKGFREYYRISSIKQILKTGVGTCIEQAKLIKFFFDQIGLENKLYCFRRYEEDENFDQDVRMHCFVLFHYQDSWYHFEHANSNKRGIHQYNSLEDAIKEEIKRHDEDDIRQLTEIPEIKEGLTFKQFNQYVNTFEPIKLESKKKR